MSKFLQVNFHSELQNFYLFDKELSTPSRERTHKKKYCIRALLRRMGLIMKTETLTVLRNHSQYGTSCILETFPNDTSKPSNTAFLKYSPHHFFTCWHLCQGVKNTGNKMPTESTVQVFPFAHLCMFSRIISKWICHNFIRKTLLATFYAKSQHSHLKPEDPALTPSKATSWHFNKPPQVQLFYFYSFPLLHCLPSNRYPIPSTEFEDRNSIWPQKSQLQNYWICFAQSKPSHPTQNHQHNILNMLDFIKNI